ncbi:spore germination protein KA [Paenibacillus sophorae]|uniref:Spore germination protein n=1 Tax=Paenibacillus sophorae TaxID=1333845 RepID=A0A1H8IZQ6_9BACL|nr:spore germination protein [Paenibacillus sophorae]QWU16130.1 spore germination protein [Paenibacillus sophorae]SEN73397.1 spore germination protein KA [Paenibacillus sophorae]
MEHGTPPINELVSGKLAQDMGLLKTILDRSSDIVFREFQLGDAQTAVIIFLDGMVNTIIVDSDIMQPLLKYGETMLQKSRLSLTGLETLLQNQVITAAQVNSGERIQEVVDHVLCGDTVLLIDGVNKALFISAKGWGKRAVEEPATEAVIRGPREGFTENLLTNISLIRRRLRTPQLKIEGLQLGQLSKTDVAIAYLEGIADDAIIAEVRERVGRIDIDAILESGYVEELIEDNSYSIFPQVNYTERPDKIVANLLEGKVGILIDNTPFALIVPVTFFEMMQASEDYYQRYVISTLIRLLRYLFLIIALLLPSLYIALLTFHQEMLPTSLLLSAAASREAVPFPAIVEALLMEISFEALREAGVRLPRPVGQSVSIVGALVIGEASVSAGIVSAPMVIIVSITGIASFIIPSYSQAITIRLLRFPMMILAGTLGLYGVLLGVLFILIHMARLRSFGVPYLSPLAPMHASDLKDALVRVPWWGMVRRSTETSKNNPRRMKGSLRPRPPKRGG